VDEFWFRPKLKGYGATPSTWEGYTTRCPVCFGGFDLRFGNDTAGENLIDLSAADGCRCRFDDRLSVCMRLEN
jgi:hypothetical protein